MKLKSEYLDGRYLVKEAEKAGLKVEKGKGDHAKVYGNAGRGYMIVPTRNIGKGLACSIIKWMIAAGVGFTIFLIVCGG